MKRSKYCLNFLVALLAAISFRMSAVDFEREEKIKNIVQFSNDSNFVEKLLERYAENKKERKNLLIDSMIDAGKYKNSYTNQRMRMKNLKRSHKALEQGFWERHPLIAGLASFGIIKYGLEYFMLKYKQEETTFNYLPALLAIYVFIRCLP